MVLCPPLMGSQTKLKAQPKPPASSQRCSHGLARWVTWARNSHCVARQNKAAQPKGSTKKCKRWLSSRRACDIREGQKISSFPRKRESRCRHASVSWHPPRCRLHFADNPNAFDGWIPAYAGMTNSKYTGSRLRGNDEPRRWNGGTRLQQPEARHRQPSMRHWAVFRPEHPQPQGLFDAVGVNPSGIARACIKIGAHCTANGATRVLCHH